MGGSGVSDDRQCVQIARIRAPAHYDTASNINDAFTHFHPGHFLWCMAGHAASDLRPCRVIGSGLEFVFGTSLLLHLGWLLCDTAIVSYAFYMSAALTTYF